jgi:hypothetical protein
MEESQSSHTDTLARENQQVENKKKATAAINSDP